MKIEEYKKLASLLNEARTMLYDKDNPFWKLPKSRPYHKHWVKATDAIDKARSESEELMYIDCPEQASTYIFYPGHMIGQELGESKEKKEAGYVMLEDEDEPPEKDEPLEDELENLDEDADDYDEAEDKEDEG